MKLGIDCREIYNPQTNEGTGVGRSIFYLVKSLLKVDQKNQYVLFLPENYPDSEFKFKNTKKVFYKKKYPFISSHIIFPNLLKKENLDLCFFPANIIPLFYNKKSLLMVHDLAMYVNKEWFPKGDWLYRKVLIPRSIKNADKIIAVSEQTKKDIENKFKVESYKVKSIYLGIEDLIDFSQQEGQDVLRKFDLKEKQYLFFIGTIEPRKNLSNLSRAFNLLKAKNIKLVLAGKKGWIKEIDWQELLKIDNVQYLGKISDLEKQVLLKNSLVFVFSSLYEGFGLPILEAQSLGVPVLTAENSSLIEVGAESVFYVKASLVEDIFQGIKKILNNNSLRQDLISKGFKNIKRFSWLKTAENLLSEMTNNHS